MVVHTVAGHHHLFEQQEIEATVREPDSGASLEQHPVALDEAFLLEDLFQA